MSGAGAAIVPESIAGVDTSTAIVPNSRKGKAEQLLGSAQDRLEILAQELVNARRAGLKISAKSVERNGAKLMLIAVYDAWKCQTCGWWNAGGDKCQNDKCQTIVPNKDEPNSMPVSTQTQPIQEETHAPERLTAAD